MPTVSVGMPVHNGEPYVVDAVESILTQDFDDFELVISDNASTDATQEICEDYARRDPRVRYVRSEENLGAAANHNRVIEFARGTYFKLASDDDVCHPAFLRRCVETFADAPPDVVLVYPQSVFIDADGRVVRADTDDLATSATQPYLRAARIVARINMVNALHGLIRADALARTRLLDSFIASDYVLLFELALQGTFVEVDERLFYRREHPGSSRGANTRLSDVLAWFDPTSTERQLLLPPRMRLLVEYLRSVARTPMSPTQRALCYATVPTVHAVRRARVLGGRWRREIGSALRPEGVSALPHAGKEAR